MVDTERINEGRSLPVRVINISLDKVTIPKEAVLGFIKEVEDEYIINDQKHDEHDMKRSFITTDDLNGVISKWCEPLQQLYERSCSNLSDQQRMNLVNLLE